MLSDTTISAFLGELTKIGEYAPGLPSKKKMSPVREQKRPQTWHMVVQHHPAVRAGNHHDIRVIDPVTRIAHSWATKKDLPGPGDEPIRVFQQPDHTEKYSREFSGHIEKGYGRTKKSSKGVQKVLDEKIEVLQADDRLIRFNAYRGRGPQEFLLVRNKTSKGAPAWTLLNVTKTREGLKDLPFSKPKYREVKPGAIDLDDPNQVMAAKLDGGHNTILLKAGRRPRIFSYREPKQRKSGAIEHSQKVEALYHTTVPKELNDTILRGELYARDLSEKKPLPGEVIGGMLNADVWKSREMQARLGKLRPAIFDVVKFKGEDYSKASYEEKLKALREVQKAMPGFEIPDLAFTRKEKQALINAIQKGTHPSTREGVVLWHHTKADRPTKAKFTVDHDVYVRDVYQAVDKHGKPKQEAGGFTYSHEPGGPVVGSIGTGFSQALRKDLFSRPEVYKGTVARVVAEKQAASGALMKPRFTSWHPDKAPETFWEKDPLAK